MQIYLKHLRLISFFMALSGFSGFEFELPNRNSPPTEGPGYAWYTPVSPRGQKLESFRGDGMSFPNSRGTIFSNTNVLDLENKLALKNVQNLVQVSSDASQISFSTVVTLLLYISVDECRRAGQVKQDVRETLFVMNDDDDNIHSYGSQDGGYIYSPENIWTRHKGRA